MSAALDDLQRYMPPTGHVPDNISWDLVEARWGVMFPEDYKAFLDIYGPGTIANSLSISAPSPDGSRDHFGGYVQVGVPLDAEMLIELECLFPAYPAPGGIFVIGSIPDGDTLLYRTAPKPADWHVVMWSRGGWLGEAWTEHAMGLSALRARREFDRRAGHRRYRYLASQADIGRSR